MFARKTDKGSSDLYFYYYGMLQHQQNMLQDYIRTGTYWSAILENAPDFQGKVVMDVGAGSGILSLFAAQVLSQSPRKLPTLHRIPQLHAVFTHMHPDPRDCERITVSAHPQHVWASRAGKRAARTSMRRGILMDYPFRLPWIACFADDHAEGAHAQCPLP